MSAAERVSDASSAEQVNEWAVRVNERTQDQMAMVETIVVIPIVQRSRARAYIWRQIPPYAF